MRKETTAVDRKVAISRHLAGLLALLLLLCIGDAREEDATFLSAGGTLKISIVEPAQDEQVRLFQGGGLKVSFLVEGRELVGQASRLCTGMDGKLLSCWAIAVEESDGDGGAFAMTESVIFPPGWSDGHSAIGLHTLSAAIVKGRAESLDSRDGLIDGGEQMEALAACETTFQVVPGLGEGVKLQSDTTGKPPFEQTDGDPLPIPHTDSSSPLGEMHLQLQKQWGVKSLSSRPPWPPNTTCPGAVQNRGFHVVEMSEDTERPLVVASYIKW
jgi:hypothetical protein